MTRRVDNSTLERAVRLLSEYANSGVPDAVSLECAQVCGKLRDALAQAHADQQARLAALAGKWQSRTEQCIEQAEKAKSRTERESWISTEIATRNCADELEAVLGGKE